MYRLVYRNVHEDSIAGELVGLPFTIYAHHLHKLRIISFSKSQETTFSVEAVVEEILLQAPMLLDYYQKSKLRLNSFDSGLGAQDIVQL